MPYPVEALTCPNCHQILVKAPSRKSKCPLCQQLIFPRTLATNKSKVLATESEAKIIKKNNAVKNGDWHEIKMSYLQQRIFLIEEGGDPRGQTVEMLKCEVREKQQEIKNPIFEVSTSLDSCEHCQGFKGKKFTADQALQKADELVMGCSNTATYCRCIFLLNFDDQIEFKSPPNKLQNQAIASPTAGCCLIAATGLFGGLAATFTIWNFLLN